jgi:hypothetical protein
MNEIVKRKASLDSLDYQMLRRQTRYLLRVGLGAIAFGLVTGFMIGSLRTGKASAGVLGSIIFAGIFAILWGIVFLIHILAYLTHKTVVAGTVLQKSIVQTPKNGNMYLLHFEGKQYNVPLAFYEQAREGRQVCLHFSNILFLFIRGEVM